VTMLSRFSEAVIEGKLDDIEQLTREAIDAKYEPLRIINEGLLPGMEEVGKRFKVQEMWIPEVLLSAETMKASVNILKPMLVGQMSSKAGVFVIGTVKGDLHDVGKNIVIILMEGAGFEVIDLGMDVSEKTFIETVREKKPNALGMSAMLTTTMMEMKKVIDLLKQEGLRDEVKVIVGGAPLNQQFSKEIGADAYADNAVTGVDFIKQLVNNN
jgi:5-methyltetrahydrofolate--homocysteine methyltransferase